MDSSAFANAALGRPKGRDVVPKLADGVAGGWSGDVFEVWGRRSGRR